MFEEWKDLKQRKDKDNPFYPEFILESGESFFVEPAFYTQLTNFKEIYPDEYVRIVDKMNSLVKERKHIIFAYDFENPFIKKDGYIYLEFVDITDSLQIFYEDKSRGSDYGD